MQQQADQHLLTTNAPLLITGGQPGSTSGITRLELPSMSNYTVTTMAGSSVYHLLAFGMMAAALYCWWRRCRHWSFMVLSFYFAATFAIELLTWVLVKRAVGIPNLRNDFLFGFGSTEDWFEFISLAQTCLAIAMIIAAIGFIRATRNTALFSPVVGTASEPPKPPSPLTN